MTAVKKEFSCFIIYCITAVSSVLTTMFFFLPVIKICFREKELTLPELVYWISCRYLLTVLHTIVISWPFITNVATVYTVS